MIIEKFKDLRTILKKNYYSQMYSFRFFIVWMTYIHLPIKIRRFLWY